MKGTPVNTDVLGWAEGQTATDGAPPTAAVVALERTRSRATRVKWYGLAALVAVLGAVGTWAVHGLSGAYYPFISGFVMIAALIGGFGPSAVAGLGSLLLAHLLLPDEGVQPLVAAEVIRLFANIVLLIVVATLAGFFRRSRIATLEREVRLEQSASAVRELLDESSDAIALTDSDLRITYVNRRAEKMFGFDHGEALGRTVDSIITPESMARVQVEVNGLSSGHTIQSEHTAIKKDGTIVDIEISARFLKGGRLLASIRDIGDRKREAERQRSERELLDGILATSVAGILMVDTVGEIMFANRRAESILQLRKGAPGDRVYLKPVWKQAALDGGAWPRESQPFRQVVATGSAVFDVRFAIVWPDARRVELSVNGAPLRDSRGLLQGVVFALNDITKARAAERALRESDRQLQQITDAMPGIVYQYIIDAEGRDRFVFVSKFSEQLLGRTARQLLDEVDSAWSLVHPDDIGHTRQSLMASFLSLAPWIHEFRIQDVHSTGSWRWISGHAIPQRGAEDGSVLWNGIFIDITDRKTLEDDLRQAQRIESVGRLAGGIAHDFNNLLTVILGQAELLSIDLPEDSPLATSVQQIRSAAESGSALTRQLLGFARKQVMAPQIIDVNMLARRVPPLVGRLLGPSIELHLDLVSTPPRVRVDPTQLDQVLVNLVVNARDAMPVGGRLDIQTRLLDPETLTRAEGAMIPPGPLVEICIRDTGVGMSDEIRDRAFEPFFTTKGMGKGTGLGLATSYGIVSQAGGTILIESEAGHGTIVRVLLPITTDVAAIPRERPPSLTPTGHETILVVDDDEAVRSVTATALRRQGYRVMEAGSGAAALALSRAEEGRIHALVTDVAMPHMSGPALAEQLLRERPEVRVLFVSGYAEDGMANHGMLDEGVALLQKPYDIRVLARRVRDLFEVKLVEQA